MFKINDTTVVIPSAMTVGIMDIDGESNRTADGTMIRDRIATKRKLQCSWNALTTTEMSTLLQSMNDEFFSVQYLDPYTGTEQTKTFYVGDRSAPVYRLVSGKELWSGLKADFVEK